MKSELNTNFIKDTKLAEDVSQFFAQCTIPAKVAYQKAVGGEPVGEAAFLLNNPFYIGSFYDEIRATKPVWGFGTIEEERGYSSTRARNSSNPSGTPEGYGYPLCSDWWSDSSKILSKDLPGIERVEMYRGLEDRLFEYYGLKDPAQCGRFVQLFGLRVVGESSLSCDGVDGISPSAILTNILKEQMLSQNEASLNAQKILMGAIGTNAQFGSHSKQDNEQDIRDRLYQGASTVGIATTSFANFSGNFALLKTMPMATSFLVLMFTALLPLGMLVSRYELEPLMGMTLMYCGYFLWIPYFRLVRWLDDNFVTMVAAGWQVEMVVVMELMISVAYIGVPIAMGAIFTIAGVRISQLDPMGSDKIASIANNGAKNIENTISNGVAPLKRAVFKK